MNSDSGGHDWARGCGYQQCRQPTWTFTPTSTLTWLKRRCRHLPFLSLMGIPRPLAALNEQPPSTSRPKRSFCRITSAMMLKARRVCIKLRLVALCMVNLFLEKTTTTNLKHHMKAAHLSILNEVFKKKRGS